ncbi:MAG: host attachment protein [Rhodospirillales bacterium]|nr:host attachment protein [Rhodospirillales bacterium]
MRKVTWVLVADGARARLLTRTTKTEPFVPALDHEFIGSNIPSREIDADRPGRSFDSAGDGRHAMEPPIDPKRKRKADFAKELAALLDVEAKRGSFDQLVVVAPPQALGDLRAEFTEAVRGRVVEEINKDLVEATVEELTARLDEALVGTMLR